MNGEDTGGREFLDYVEAPLRRPVHVLIPFVLVLATSVAVSFALPSRYVSSTLILVEYERVPDSFVRRVTTDVDERRLLTLKQEILSRSRLEKIIEELDPHPEQTEASLSDLVERMRGSITVGVKGADAFSIEYAHTDPHKAMAVADRLATLFIEEVTASRQRKVEEAAQFMGTQVEEARAELETLEATLRSFKHRNMGSLPEQTGANLATLERLQAEKQGVELQLRAAMDRIALAEQNAAAGVVDPDSELRQLRSQLAELRTRYTDEHPDVRALVTRVEGLEKALKERPKANATVVKADDPVVGESRREVEALTARRDELDQRIALFQARVEQSPRTEQALTVLTRDLEQARATYSSLLSRNREATMAQRLEERWKGEQFRILDPAFLPDKPYSPNRRLFVLAGAVFGLLLGVAVAIGAEELDRTMKNVRDLEATLPFPVLATIPRMKRRRRGAGRGDS